MPRLTKAMMSEAGAWMARLNGPYRTPSVEQGFQQWLKDDPGHPEAFRLVSVDWEGMEELRRFANVSITAPVSIRPARRPKAALRKGPWLAVAALCSFAVVGGWLYHWQTGAITTGIGEQRILTLEDGTKVSLNTSTRIVVQYDKARRRVRLDSGEALFDVAKQAARPFVVSLGDRDVTALGTAFLVRRDDHRTTVTLIEGEVAVSRPSDARGVHVSEGAHERKPGDSGAGAEGGDADAFRLKPGERFTFASSKQPPRIDHPFIDKLTAWQQGKVAIDRMRLCEAVDEMNRYSPIRIVIEQPESQQLLVSGVFAAGQSGSFARAVAQSYGLQVIDHGDTIRLAGRARVPD